MNAPLADLLTRFAAIVGPMHAIQDPAEIAPYLHEPRKLYHGRAALVLKPGTTEEVARILTLANETKTPVVAQGGNTGLVGGQTAQDARAIILSTLRLNRIREIDPASSTMTCEAGVLLARAQEAAAEHDRFFPLSLGAEGSCTIGGNLATNAGGTAVLAYGNMRELALGLEVVLADGRVWHGLGKLKKDNTGYDLRNLFIGSEGTLGIITAAVLKLFPAQRAIETAMVGLASPETALELFTRVHALAGTALTGFELMPRLGLEFVLKHVDGARDPLAAPHPWYALIELSSPTELGLRAMMERILADAGPTLVADATIAASEAQRRAFWRMRGAFGEVQSLEGGSIKHDISVPVARVPELLRRGSEAVAKLIPGVRPMPFGHFGDGNIHFNFSQPISAERETFLARWDEVSTIVHAIVAELGGSVAAEHGIGLMKRVLLAKVKDPVGLELMRTIKRALDPNGILNPGKVL